MSLVTTLGSTFQIEALYSRLTYSSVCHTGPPTTDISLPVKCGSSNLRHTPSSSPRPGTRAAWAVAAASTAPHPLLRPSGGAGLETVYWLLVFQMVRRRTGGADTLVLGCREQGTGPSLLSPAACSANFFVCSLQRSKSELCLLKGHGGKCTQWGGVVSWKRVEG